MASSSLGKVLGRVLARTSGLGHVHLPEGIASHTAEEIVRSANQAKRLNPPFALLVTNGPESLQDVDCPRVSPARTIQYRQGDHLAVVHGRQPDLSSFVQVFREIFGQSFPEQAEGAVSLHEISNEIVQEVCEQFSVVGLSSQQKARCSDTVLGILATLSTIHSRAGDTGRSWNSAWFAHVDYGLSNIPKILGGLRAAATHLELTEALDKYAYACFALPTPKPGVARSFILSDAGALGLMDALMESWSDEDAFRMSVAQLPTRQEVKETGGEHALSEFDLDGFDDAVSREGNAWLGLVDTVGASPENIERFSALTEEQFRSPARDDETLTFDISLEGGRSLALDPDLPESPFLIPLVSDGSAGGRQLQSELLTVRIPTLDRLHPDEARESGLTILCQPANVADWVGTVEVAGDGELIAIGRFIRPRGNGRSAAPFRLVTLKVVLPSGDPLATRVRNDLTAKAYVFSGMQTFLAAAPFKKRGGLGKITYLGQMEWTPVPAIDVSELEFAEELPEVSGGYQALLWCPNAMALPLLDGVALRAHPILQDLFALRFAPTGENEFVANSFTFRVRPVAAGGGHQSALLAAAVKQQVVPDRPKPATEGSVRGQAEAFYASRLVVGDTSIVQALGHIMMPSNESMRIEDSRPQDHGAFMMPDAARRALDSVSYFKVDEHFVRGTEAERFRAAFRSLRVEELLIRQDVRGEGVEFEWPSRTSWRSLWGDPALSEYLDAYGDLLVAARATGRDENVFWAAYPMSVSAWDVKGDNGCQAVLLSPLHPIRLAWLAGAEHSLFEAENSVEHAGSVEGWNLPLVGPGESVAGRMLAVPADSGEDQIFLGWSMMLPAAKSRPKRLAPPDRIGNAVTPGAAVSGLNATAVDAALRSFRRMHPHISTLTVDLHALDRQNRLTEIDDSVLALAEEWGSAKTGRLIGGVRVLDSVRREGPVPRDAVTKLVRDNRDMLLTWSRYAPQSEAKVWCNIRLLQDSGTIVRVDSGGGSHGVLGEVPLRRFESSLNRLSDRRSSLSQPAIPSTVGWGSFSRALEACETGDSAPLIEAAMMRRDVADTTADWTVMGESFLSPAIMAELMDAHSEGARMLWEWRPPVFERSPDVPFMERRPFVSIAKVPDSFGQQLERLLAKATGREDIAQLKRRVMSSLGSRGVGLSSLLSMGGTHVAGAVGFYLTFGLFDKAVSDGSNRFVVPIDAADYFLRTLSGQANHGQHQRRADLLFIEMRDDELILCPVEIKCYGLKGDSIGSRLPAQGASALDEPLEQLAASARLLQNIEFRAAEVAGADRVIWMNSLATLVETAARLSSTVDSPVDFARRLSSLVDGRMAVRLGKPLLTYLQHGSTTSGGQHFYAGEVGTADAPVRGLIADTAKVFEALEGPEASVVHAWRELVDWAVEEPNEEGILASRTAPEVLRQDFDESADGSSGVQNQHDYTPESLPLTGVRSQLPSVPPVNAVASKVSGISGDGIRINVGNLLGSIGQAPVDFWPSNTKLNQMNVGIVGDLGTGKTELVKALISQIREQAAEKQPFIPTSMLIFDYKGDFQKEEFVSRIGAVVLEPHEIPLNVFMPVTGEHSRLPYQQAAAFVDVLRKIYRGVGPVQSSLLNEAVRNLYDRNDNRPPTLAEVRAEYLEKSGNPDSVSSILDSFVLSQIFSSDRSKLMPFGELLNGRVVVVALDRLGPDQSAKNALVALFLNLYYDNMLRSDRPPFQGTEPQLRFLKSFLLVDEAVNIMRYDFQVLMDLMLQGRQFGYGVMLASQYLSHFKEGRENFGQPLRTWFIHKVPSVNARELASLGLPDLAQDVPRRIPELRQHEVLYKSLGYDEGRFVRVKPYYERYGL
ncbi:SPG23_c9, whole genome shotgun sequence [Arthrobacter sp. 9V]|uniref:ATP-binding protein n=1 Tax=Arthrobacter sp. 9V TaxID=2653132 RepID=UPI0012F08084|nr:type IV secretion system DNA-binding domain-containing protein [Arthrobacter sp. 9V]VXC05845.1 SPG23_c9, whole genome shotgun sequence [Arthrobacter sp. 9V]